jgi:bifunctional non-homologous end joining protein LigD
MVQIVKNITPPRRRSSRRTESLIRVGGRELKVSNLDKPLYPNGFTKAQILDYYTKISPVLLPHLKARPFTLKRYPEGTENGFFYEKQCPRYRPEWIPTIRVDRESERKPGVIDYCSVDDLASLIWIANLASIELHVLLSTKASVKRPTAVAFDFDPGAPANLVDCCDIALRMKALFDKLDLRSFPKTSGGKGLHVYVPLNTPVDFDRTKAFARSLAQTLEEHDPKRVTSNMSKSLRKGRVFVDWSQNDEHKTTVCAYSLRAREAPTVSTPVSWQEVERCAVKRDPEALRFEAPDVLARVARHKDLFEPVLKLRQKLPAVRV